MDEGQRAEDAVEERTIIGEGHDKEDAVEEETMMEAIQGSKDAGEASTCNSSVSNNNETLSGNKGAGGEQGKKRVRNQPAVGSKYVRVKHKCPFPSCKSKVYHLPRHEIIPWLEYGRCAERGKHIWFTEKSMQT